MKAKISEIFYSLQGEGIYQNRPQIFIRFWGCNLKCAFCDTSFPFYKELTLKEIIEVIQNYPYPRHSISLTGGEPLLQYKFLKELCFFLKEQNQKIYLETNGTLYKELQEVIDFIDIVAMDFKLPSSTKERVFWQEHKKFLRVAVEKEVFVKAVITPYTCFKDIFLTAEIIKEIEKNIPLILQPQYGYETLLWRHLETLREKLSETFLHVEVIPQLHKKLGIK